MGRRHCIKTRLSYSATVRPFIKGNKNTVSGPNNAFQSRVVGVYLKSAC